MQKVLFIGLVWPEPQSSAAGWRIIQLVKAFQENGFEVTFASAAGKSDYSCPLTNLAVAEVPIALNDARFDAFVKDLNPAIVVFDRFMIEEQYGWRVRENCPDALTLLDTEDLHFLRLARQEASKKGTPIQYFSDTAKREIASILRCDLSLIISQAECDLLINTFHIHPSLLYYLPFMEAPLDAHILANKRSYVERKDFMFIGNFLHEPNWRTVQVLKTEIWPLLRKQVPDAALHIYGAYASEKVLQLHKPTERFYICGRADDARQTMEQYRVLLAPIPFGAGIKGKFVDAMYSGTPNVSSVVGAEDMYDGAVWNGLIADDAPDFSAQATRLYTDEKLWHEAQKNGLLLANRDYAGQEHAERFLEAVVQLQAKLNTHRQANFIGQILHTQANNSLKYMSLWIQEKEKNKTTSP